MEKKRGSTDQYSCVWYLNYMQKEDKMPSKDVCLCIYVCIYIYAFICIYSICYIYIERESCIYFFHPSLQGYNLK